jgi:hypothetical protein
VVFRAARFQVCDRSLGRHPAREHHPAAAPGADTIARGRG